MRTTDGGPVATTTTTMTPTTAIGRRGRPGEMARSGLALPVVLLTLAAHALLGPRGLAAQPVAAQQDTAKALPMTCWRGAPPPACGGFFLIEVQGAFPFLSTVREHALPGGGVFRRDAFESRVEWNLGYMVNVGPEWAFGGAVSLGSGSYDALTGIRARARRWIAPPLSVELQGGVVLTHAANSGGPRPLKGFTTDARLNIGDHGSLFLRWDVVKVPTHVDHAGVVYQPGGIDQALHVGVGTGSTWTLAGTAALGIWYAVVIAALVTS